PDSLSLYHSWFCHWYISLTILHCLFFQSSYSSPVAADFYPLSESLTFHDGGRQCVNISIVTGDALENVEKFSVVLSTRDERLEIKRYYATVYIVEDGTVRIGFSQIVYQVEEEDENGEGSIVEICVEAGDLDRDVNVYVTTSSQTAIAGEDYSDVLAELRVLKFKFQRRRRFIGSITEEQCFNVTILSDPFVEEDEVFLVQLSTDDSGVVLSPEEAEVVILNNDIIVQMELAEYNVCEGVGSLMVCAAVTGRTVTSSFTLATNPGTATAPEDYEDVSLEVVGEQIPCLSITIKDDMERESCDETFTVVLSTSDPSVIIVSPNTSTVTIYDNEEPRIEFINNTPDSTGFNISSEFQIEGCINQTMCTIRQTGESIACQNSASFTQERNGARTLIITASGVCGNSQTLSRILRSDVPVCDVHQINGGVEQATVDGNSATVLFEGTGPSVDNVVTDFGLSIRRASANIVTGLMCSTAATQAPSPFTVTCSFFLLSISYPIVGHGEVTVSGFDSSGTWAIAVRPIEPSVDSRLCRRRIERTFTFDI
ncbi:hypothetical protein GBAR_LOCUS23568, partial [Geodia barretti]